MNDDFGLMSLLTSTYKDEFKKSMEDIYTDSDTGKEYNIRNDGFIKRNGSDDKKIEIDRRNSILKAYMEEDKLITQIKNKRIAAENDIRNIRAKNGLFSLKEEEKTTNTMLNSYKKLYADLHDKDAKFKTEKDKAELKIYLNAIKNNRELTTEELKQLKLIEKERLNSDENVRKKKEQNIEKLKNGLKKTIDIVFKDLDKMSDMFFFDRVKEGTKNLSSAYEKDFTTIAGYTGSDSRQGNHNFIKGVLQEVNANDYTKKGLNFSEDVFPEITNAVKKGFMGDEATDVAISNAIDNKIMPWLDTSSETWVNMQYQLADDSLRQIKGQQLLLQETREGNRLLQSGVISQIQDMLLPSLINIESNTTEFDDLNKDMQKEYLYLTEDMGYTKQEALAYIKKEADAYQNPYSAITSNDLATQLMGMDRLFGTNYSGTFTSSMIGSGWVGAGVLKDLGFVMGGETRSEDGIIANATIKEGKEKWASVVGDGLTSEEFERIYTNGLQNLPEDRTATAAYDAEIENFWAHVGIDSNMIAHGADMQQMLLDNVINIKTILITQLIPNLLNNGIDKLFKKGDNTNNLLSKVLTGGKGFSGALEAGSNAGKVSGMFKGAGTGLKSGGLIGGLAQGGAGLSGGALSGGAAAGLGAGVLLAGGAMAAKGVGTITDTIQNWEDNSATDNAMGLGTGLVATAGGGMAAAAALGLASGPVGWIGLAVGGIALLGKAAYDNATALTGNAAAVESGMENIIDSMNKEADAREYAALDVKTQIDAAKDENEKRQILINSGLITESEARTLNEQAINELTQAFVLATGEFTPETEGLLDEAKQLITNDVNDLTKIILDELETDFESTDTAGKTYLDKEQMAKLNLLASGVENEDFQSTYNDYLEDKKISHAEAYDLLYGGSNSWWDDVNLTDQVIDNKAITRYMTKYKPGEKYTVWDENAANEAANLLSQLEEKNKMLEFTTDENAKNIIKDDMKTLLTSFGDSAAIKSLKDNMGEGGQLILDDINKYNKMFNMKEFKIGSSYIPYDMIAQLHAGERVLTEGQNKKYTEELVSGNSASSIIQAGVQDIVISIKQQTQDIINYLSTISFNNSMSSTSKYSMLPEMGNIKLNA